MSILYDNNKSLLGNLGIKAAPTATPTPAPILNQKPITPPPVATPKPQVIPQQKAPVAKLPITPQAAPLAQRPNSFFSGNILDKVFDVLRAPEYAIAGFNRGTYNAKQAENPGKALANYGDVFSGKQKVGIPSPQEFIKLTMAGLKNVIPGIQTRTSFSSAPGDFNAAKQSYGVTNPVANAVTNTGISLGAPTLPIGKIAKATGISSLLSKGAGAVSNVARNIPQVAKVVENFSPYFRNPEVGKMVQESENVVGGRLTNLYDLLKSSIKGLSPAEQSRVGQLLEGGITTNPKFEQIAAPIRKVTEQISKELLNQGKLTPETYQKFSGRYMSHIFEEAKKSSPIINMTRTLPGVGTGFLKERKGAEGYVKQFAAPVFKGLGSEIKSVEATNLYKKIADKFGTALEEAKPGFVNGANAIKNADIGRIFKGKAIPPEVADYINRLEKTPDKQGFIGKLTNLWKQGVTIYNPAYHARNLISNQMLSSYSTGRGVPGTVADCIKSVVNYAGKGNQDFTKAAKEVGLIKNPNLFEGTQEFLDKAFQRGNPVKSAFNIPRRFQQATEETSKLNVFQQTVERLAGQAKVSVKEALKDKNILGQAKNAAEEAIFSPYRIGKTERGFVKSAIPFYSFTRQALPFFAKTVVQHPERVTGAPRLFDSLTRNTVGNPPDLPQNLQGQTDIGQNKQGKDVFFNPQYVTPYGNFDTGGFLNKGQLPFGFSLNPFLQFLSNAIYKKNAFTGQKLYQSNVPSENVKQGAVEARRAFTPTFVNSIIDKIAPAFEGQPDYTGGTRGVTQSLVDSILGLKTKAYDRQYLKGKVQQEQNSKLRSIQTEFKNSNDPQLRSKLKGVYNNYVQGIR